ncbi:MAG TPA: nitrilase-related carbon-nitrogen hydrolase [Clostridia bacterium]
MKIAIVNSIDFKGFALSHLQTITDIDIIIFAFGVTGEIDLAKEILGTSQVYSELVLLSLTLNCVVIAAMDTTVYGLKHKSAVIIEDGHILDINDMVHVYDDEYDKGKGFRVYDTSKGKLGIIIHNDILFPESSRMLTIGGCDLLITLIDTDLARNSLVMARAASISNGIYNICSETNASYYCDEFGIVQGYTRKDFLEIDIKPRKDILLIQSRRKDKYKEIFSNFL